MAIADLIALDIDSPTGIPSLGVYKVLIHMIITLFSFLALCIIAPVISAENQYQGYSNPAPNFSLVTALLSMFISAALAFFPWSRFNGYLPKIRNFFLRPRTDTIFTVFLTLLWFINMISMTVHSSNSANCDLDSNLEKSDSNYASSWLNQCNCSKGVTALSWFTFFFSAVTAVCSVLLIWYEKKSRVGELEKQQCGQEDASTIVDEEEYSEKYNAQQYSPVSSPAPVTASTTASPKNHHHNGDFGSPYAPSPLAALHAIPYGNNGNVALSAPYQSTNNTSGVTAESSPYHAVSSPNVQRPSSYLQQQPYYSSPSPIPSYHQQPPQPQHYIPQQQHQPVAPVQVTGYNLHHQLGTPQPYHQQPYM